MEYKLNTVEEDLVLSEAEDEKEDPTIAEEEHEPHEYSYDYYSGEVGPVREIKNTEENPIFEALILFSRDRRRNTAETSTLFDGGVAPLNTAYDLEGFEMSTPEGTRLTKDQAKGAYLSQLYHYYLTNLVESALTKEFLEENYKIFNLETCPNERVMEVQIGLSTLFPETNLGLLRPDIVVCRFDSDGTAEEMVVIEVTGGSAKLALEKFSKYYGSETGGRTIVFKRGVSDIQPSTYKCTPCEMSERALRALDSEELGDVIGDWAQSIRSFAEVTGTDLFIASETIVETNIFMIWAVQRQMSEYLDQFPDYLFPDTRKIFWEEAEAEHHTMEEVWQNYKETFYSLRREMYLGRENPAYLTYLKRRNMQMLLQTGEKMYNEFGDRTDEVPNLAIIQEPTEDTPRHEHTLMSFWTDPYKIAREVPPKGMESEQETRLKNILTNYLFPGGKYQEDDCYISELLKMTQELDYRNCTSPDLYPNFSEILGFGKKSKQSGADLVYGFEAPERHYPYHDSSQGTKVLEILSKVYEEEVRRGHSATVAGEYILKMHGEHPKIHNFMYDAYAREITRLFLNCVEGPLLNHDVYNSRDCNVMMALAESDSRNRIRLLMLDSDIYTYEPPGYGSKVITYDTPTPGLVAQSADSVASRLTTEGIEVFQKNICTGIVIGRNLMGNDSVDKKQACAVLYRRYVPGENCKLNMAGKILRRWPHNDQTETVLIAYNFFPYQLASVANIPAKFAGCVDAVQAVYEENSKPGTVLFDENVSSNTILARLEKTVEETTGQSVQSQVQQMYFETVLKSENASLANEGNQVIQALIGGYETSEGLRIGHDFIELLQSPNLFWQTREEQIYLAEKLQAQGILQVSNYAEDSETAKKLKEGPDFADIRELVCDDLHGICGDKLKELGIKCSEMESLARELTLIHHQILEEKDNTMYSREEFPLLELPEGELKSSLKTPADPVTRPGLNYKIKYVDTGGNVVTSDESWRLLGTTINDETIV